MFDLHRAVSIFHGERQLGKRGERKRHRTGGETLRGFATCQLEQHFGNRILLPPEICFVHQNLATFFKQWLTSDVITWHIPYPLGVGAGEKVDGKMVGGKSIPLIRFPTGQDPGSVCLTHCTVVQERFVKCPQSPKLQMKRVLSKVVMFLIIFKIVGNRTMLSFEMNKFENTHKRLCNLTLTIQASVHKIPKRYL